MIITFRAYISDNGIDIDPRLEKKNLIKNNLTYLDVYVAIK